MHDCPACGQARTCSGDIEDHDTGFEFQDECIHCSDDEADDDGFDEFDEERPAA